MGAKLESRAIFDALTGRFNKDGGDAVHTFTDVTPKPEPGSKAQGGVKDAFCFVKPEALVAVMTHLRDDPAFRFDFLQCLTAVDWLKAGTLQVVYHLYSYDLRHTFIVKAETPRDTAVIPSVCGVWPTADWHEREQYDLFGVQFSGHPDLRRLLMPDDWPGHPMRKDNKEAAEYRGMPTVRYSPLDLLLAYDKAHPGTEGQRPIAPPKPVVVVPPKAGA